MMLEAQGVGPIDWWPVASRGAGEQLGGQQGSKSTGCQGQHERHHDHTPHRCAGLTYRAVSGPLVALGDG